MFDPNYCPESIDLVIANDDLLAMFISDMRFSYSKLGEVIGISFTPRIIREEDLQKAILGETNKALSSITKDSIVLAHAELGGKMRGAKAVKAILDNKNKYRNAASARYLLDGDLLFDDKMRALFGSDYDPEVPSPTKQINFYYLREDNPINPKNKLRNYFVELGKLRKK